MNRSLWFVGFAALLLAALVLLPLSGAWLPDVVATSFSPAGEAHGFARRTTYLTLMLGLMVGVPLTLVVGIDLVARHAPGLIAVPHRDNWFAPAHRAESTAFLRLHIVRLGCVLVLFFAALHGLVLQANLTPPAHFPMSATIAPIVLFAAALIGWAIVWRRRFHAPG